MSFKSVIISFLVTLFAVNLYSQNNISVEPPSWWSGMVTPLQLMINAENIKGAEISCDNRGFKISAVHNCDSPNYLFVDITLDENLPAGSYPIRIKSATIDTVINYTISSRRNDGMANNSFNKGDLIYLLMPDRFYNGDTSNDSVDYLPEKVNREDVLGRHGGDIAGIIKALDYLNSLGVTAVWSTPLLLDNEPKVSYHGYACADYYSIDPRFGTNEQYRKYVQEAKKRGIKIVQDFVPNHCGLAHKWVKDTPFKNWIHTFPSYTQSNFAMTAHADPHASDFDKERLIKGWFDTSMPDMNIVNPFLNHYFVQNLIWWIEWADLAGIRVDTYPYSDKHAAAEMMKAVRREYPKISIVGECWFHSAQEISYWEGGSDNKDGYDSYLTHVMDFTLQDAIFLALNEDADPNWGEGMFRIYKVLSQDYIYRDPYSLMIFADNHDTNRIAELLKKNPSKFKMMLTILATMRGMPQIYAGTEIMLSTQDGKLGHGEERIDMPGGWPGDSKSIFAGTNLLDREQDVLNHTKKLFNWRKNSKAVIDGKIKHYWPIGNLYTYFRYTNQESVMVVINNNIKDQPIEWSRYKESTNGFTKLKTIDGSQSYTIGEELIIPAQTSIILELQR